MQYASVLLYLHCCTLIKLKVDYVESAPCAVATRDVNTRQSGCQVRHFLVRFDAVEILYLSPSLQMLTLVYDLLQSQETHRSPGLRQH